MSPKEKAVQLYNKFRSENSVTAANIRAKKQALILVDEMLSLGLMVGSDLSDSFYIYWQSVKSEISNL